MQKPPLTNLDCLCPRCCRIAPVIAEDDRLGEIYECFKCTRPLWFDGRMRETSLKWAIDQGSKIEVSGK